MADLRSVVHPVALSTEGADYRVIEYKVRNHRQHSGALEIPKALRQIFSVRSLENVDTITCWYDVLRDWGDKSHYLHLSDVLMMGVFYRVEDGVDVVSHFFVRKLEDYWGPLDRWKADLQFPSGVRKFSVCAILPQGFVMPERGERDPHNHAVTQFTWEQLRSLGVDVPALLGYLMYGD